MKNKSKTQSKTFFFATFNDCALKLEQRCERKCGLIIRSCMQRLFRSSSKRRQQLAC